MLWGTLKQTKVVKISVGKRNDDAIVMVFSSCKQWGKPFVNDFCGSTYTTKCWKYKESKSALLHLMHTYVVYERDV